MASGMRGALRGRLMPVIAERFEVKVREKDEAQAKPEWCLGAAAFLALSPGAARAGWAVLGTPAQGWKVSG